MRKLSSLWAPGVLAFAFVPSAFAGDYHVGATMKCGDCHVLHTPAQAAIAAGPLDELQPSRQSGRGSLLKKDINAVCLSCHDGSSRAADVLGTNQGSSASAVRQAGYLNRLGNAGRTGTGHTLGSNEFAPGSRPPWQPSLDGSPTRGLDCVHCHVAHGSREAYRNLRSDAGWNLPGEGLVTYNHEAPGTLDLSRDVFVRRTLTYDESAVDFNEPEPKDSAIARFCSGCHGGFHGRPGGKRIGGEHVGRGFKGFVRHPAAGVNIGMVGGEHSSLELFSSHSTRVKVMSAKGSWRVPGVDVTPTCITCHKAHGNGNLSGLIFRSGSGVPTEDGDTDGNSIQDLCGQCHVQGTPFGQRQPQP